MDIKTCLSNIGVEGIEVSGMIDKLYLRKSGTSEKWGDWSFQGLEISDGSGSIEVSLKNIPEMPKDKKGQQVTFQSVFVESQQKKMGVKIAEDEYKDKDGNEKKVIKVVVTGSANITYGTTQKPTEEKPVGGHQPTESLDNSTPPQGGSGVPSTEQEKWARKDNLFFRNKTWISVFITSLEKFGDKIDMKKVRERADDGMNYTYTVSAQDVARWGKEASAKSDKVIEAAGKKEKEKEEKEELPEHPGEEQIEEKPEVVEETTDNDYEGYSEAQKREYSVGFAKDYLKQINGSTTIEELREIGKKMGENKKLLKPDSNTLQEIYKAKAKELLPKREKGIPY